MCSSRKSAAGTGSEGPQSPGPQVSPISWACAGRGAARQASASSDHQAMGFHMRMEGDGTLAILVGVAGLSHTNPRAGVYRSVHPAPGH